jgi:hypothetical protein
VKDYALFALDYMNYQIENQRFDNSTYGFWSGNYDGDYNIDINFRTDSSLIYQPICNPTSMVAVRGIMDVKVLSATNAENFTRIYGIENPKVGETYSIDWEFVLTTSGYGYIYDIGNFRYTDTGNVVSFINGTI